MSPESRTIEVALEICNAVSVLLCHKPFFVVVVVSRVPNMVAWGTVGGVALIHFTDWRLVLDYVPYIKGKFSNDDE